MFELDISGVNEYFKGFKDDESNGAGENLPPVETIIAESLKVKINEEWLDALKSQYKQLQSPKKEPKTRTVKLKKIRQEALHNLKKEQQHFEVEQAHEEEKIMMVDIQDESHEMQEEQQAKSSNNHVGGSSSGGLNVDLSAGQERKDNKTHFLP